LKTIYGSANEAQAKDNLEAVKNKWNSLYPLALKNWEDNWNNLITFFEYPAEIRKVIYTTNPTVSLHRRFRKITKTKQIFPHDDSLKKILYMVSKDTVKKWTQRYKNWDAILKQLTKMFPENNT
jgi:transposase-like protein